MEEETRATLIIVGIVCILIGLGFGFVLSDGVPEIINLEESQKNSLLNATERSIEDCERKYDREINKLTKDNMKRIKELAETNQNLMKECKEEIIPKIEDLKEIILDLNQTVKDINMADINC